MVLVVSIAFVFFCNIFCRQTFNVNAFLTRVCYACAMGVIQGSNYAISSERVIVVQKAIKQNLNSSIANDYMNKND